MRLWVSLTLLVMVGGFTLGLFANPVTEPAAHTCCVDSGHCTDCYFSGTPNPIGGGRCEGDIYKGTNCTDQKSWYDKCTDEYATNCCQITEYQCDANRDGNWNTCREREQVPMSNCP